MYALWAFALRTNVVGTPVIAETIGSVEVELDSFFTMRPLELARVQYDVGQIDLLSLLQIQTKWIGARIGLLRIQNDRLAQRVNLRLALGGSFEPANGSFR